MSTKLDSHDAPLALRIHVDGIQHGQEQFPALLNGASAHSPGKVLEPAEEGGHNRLRISATLLAVVPVSVAHFSMVSGPLGPK